MNGYCQTLSRAYNEILHLKQILEYMEQISAPQAHFLNAIIEFNDHVREQLMIHDGYCCSCDMGFSRARTQSSDSTDSNYELNIP